MNEEAEYLAIITKSFNFQIGIGSLLLTAALRSRPELDGRGQGSDFPVHFFGPVRLRRRLVPGDGVGGEQALRGDLAPSPLDDHGARQGEVGVQVADGEVEAVFEAFVLRSPARSETRLSRHGCGWCPGA